MIIKHKKGRHHCSFWGKLYILWCAVFRKSITVSFNHESVYKLNTHDQKDWNKIIGRGGLSYDFKKRIRKSESLYAWRYNPTIHAFEIAEYWRKDWEFGFNVVYVLHDKQEVVLPLTHLDRGFPLGGYFGGNLTPPYNIQYSLQ